MSKNIKYIKINNLVCPCSHDSLLEMYAKKVNTKKQMKY